MLGLRKVIEFIERKMIESDPDPKESDYLTISVNQYQMIDIKHEQEEMKKITMLNCDRINTILDYLKAFKGICQEEQDSQPRTTDEVTCEQKDQINDIENVTTESKNSQNG